VCPQDSAPATAGARVSTGLGAGDSRGSCVHRTRRRRQQGLACPQDSAPATAGARVSTGLGAALAVSGVARTTNQRAGHSLHTGAPPTRELATVSTPPTRELATLSTPSSSAHEPPFHLQRTSQQSHAVCCLARTTVSTNTHDPAIQVLATPHTLRESSQHLTPSSGASISRPCSRDTRRRSHIVRHVDGVQLVLEEAVP